VALKKAVTGEVLASGRGVKYRAIGTMALLEIAEKWGERTARAAKEIVIVCLVAVTRGPLPAILKSVEVERPNPDTGDIEKKIEEVLDEEAMLAAADSGAGGGWVAITEQTLRTSAPENEFSFNALFEDAPADFTQLSVSIVEVSGLGNMKRGGPTKRVTFAAQ
jgi:hypothetical protein